MKFLIERKNYYKEGDKVLIEYWYNDMITIVKILKKVGNKYLVSHSIEGSKISNAPDELVSSRDIIDFSR